jgi:outer membrane protein OmpA-like peptidoglycan-associated protein
MSNQSFLSSRLAVALAAACIFASGCATMDHRPVVLDDARVAVEGARADPQVVKWAPGELDRADSAYDQADSLYRTSGDSAQVHHLAYLAMQRAAIAQQTAKLKSAEQTIVDADAERERVRLLAKTQEAEDASRLAAQALAVAEASRRDTLAAEQKTRAMQSEVQQAQQRAQQAQVASIATEQQLRAADARAEQLAAELRELKAQPGDRGVVVTLDDVLFDTGRAQLRSGGLRVVQRIAEFMAAYPNRSVAIEGFTDSVGTDEYNRDLSQRRAEAVKSALVDAGIAADRIATHGYGEQYPVATNDTSAGRQQNRRVEVLISDPQGRIQPRIARYGAVTPR